MKQAATEDHATGCGTMTIEKSITDAVVMAGWEAIVCTVILWGIQVCSCMSNATKGNQSNAH